MNWHPGNEDWQPIGFWFISVWQLIWYWHWIDIRLAQDLHQIGNGLTMNWRSNGIGLPFNWWDWRGLLSLDWQWIKIILLVHWPPSDTGGLAVWSISASREEFSLNFAAVEEKVTTPPSRPSTPPLPPSLNTLCKKCDEELHDYTCCDDQLELCHDCCNELRVCCYSDWKGGGFPIRPKRMGRCTSHPSNYVLECEQSSDLCDVTRTF